MGIDRNAPPHSLASLLKSVESGDLGLPDFQREFIWTPDDVVELLRTIAREWPCGSFLLQSAPQPFACKALEDAPPLKPQPKLLVLDGQQRLTALYHAIRERGDETYYVDMGKLADAKSLDDDHILYQKKEKYKKQYLDLEAEALARVVRVSTLTKDPEFFQWSTYLKEPHRSRSIRLRDEQLAGFKHYSIPCVVLDQDVPLAAVAKIFETVNRTGVKLDTFDLMVAKLYPYKFRLREEWEKALEQHPETLLRFEIDGIELLKTIALHEHLRQLNSRTSPMTVKGVRESDVIELEAATVKSMWKEAVEAYHSALVLLRTECGVSSPRLLPASAMVLPVANTLWEHRRKRAGFEEDVKRWFWCSCAQQTYAQGANTQCVLDARQLSAFMSDVQEVPAAISNFNEVDEELLLDARKRNQILTRALLCSVALNGARDWFTNEPISTMPQAPEAHRIFSKKDDVDGDAVIDYTALSPASRKAAMKLTAVDVAAKVGRDLLKEHFISEKALRSGDWAAVRKQRAKLVSSLLWKLAMGRP